MIFDCECDLHVWVGVYTHEVLNPGTHQIDWNKFNDMK